MIGYIVFGLAVLAMISRFAARRAPSGPAFGFFLAVFLVGGAAAAVVSPTTIHFMVDHELEPFPQFTYLVGGVLSLAAAFCVISMLSYALNEPGIARRRTVRHAVLLVASAAAMTVLLVALHPRRSADFLTDYGHELLAVVYIAVYIGYIGAAATEFLLLILGYFRERAPRRRLKIGLGMEIGGAILALLWAGVNLAAVLLHYAGVDRAAAPLGTVIALLSGSTIGLMTLGAAWTVWAAPVVEILARVWTWRAVRTLYPLWQQVSVVGDQWILPRSDAAPAPSATPADPPDASGGQPPAEVRSHAPFDRRNEFLLYRRIIEIRDWQYRLRPHVHPDVRGWVTERARHQGLGEADIASLIEAAELAAALEAYATGRRHRRGRDYETGPAARVASNQFYEVRALVGMARALRTSPIVADVARAARRHQSPDVSTPVTEP